MTQRGEAREGSQLDAEAFEGLCSSCRQVRRLPNDRGRVFVFCQASRQDPRMPKYPYLPVYICPAYDPVQGDDSTGVQTEKG